MGWLRFVCWFVGLFVCLFTELDFPALSLRQVCGLVALAALLSDVLQRAAEPQPDLGSPSSQTDGELLIITPPSFITPLPVPSGSVANGTDFIFLFNRKVLSFKLYVL